MPVGLEVTSDVHLLEAAFDRRARQIPFALARAINDTVKDAQAVQRRHQRRVFEVRRPQFVDRAVKIKPFATKRKLEATISIDPPGGQSRADILAKFERGGRKRPRSGRSISIPIEVRRTPKGLVRAGDRPRRFQFRRVGGAVRGERRTFIVKRVGIFQRVGRRRSSRIRLLFAFKPSVPIDRRLEFIPNIERVVARRFGQHFSRRFAEAVRTAR